MKRVLVGNRPVLVFNCLNCGNPTCLCVELCKVKVKSVMNSEDSDLDTNRILSTSFNTLCDDVCVDGESSSLVAESDRK